MCQSVFSHVGHCWSRLLKTVLTQGVRSPLSGIGMYVFVGLIPSRHVLYRPFDDSEAQAPGSTYLLAVLRTRQILILDHPLARVKGSLVIHRSDTVCECAARSHRYWEPSTAAFRVASGSIVPSRWCHFPNSNHHVHPGCHHIYHHSFTSIQSI